MSIGSSYSQHSFPAGRPQMPPFSQQRAPIAAGLPGRTSIPGKVGKIATTGNSRLRGNLDQTRSKSLEELLKNSSSNKKDILALIKKMTTEQLNHVTKYGDSALNLALLKDADPEIITALAKKYDVNLSLNDNNDTALTIAICNEYPKKAILALIEAMTTEQLNHVTKNGVSALKQALYKDADPEIIKALAKKCDVNLSLNDNNDTALTLAIFNKFPIDGILALIKEMEPEQLNHVTQNGDSALQLALSTNADPEIITALAKKDADPEL